MPCKFDFKFDQNEAGQKLFEELNSQIIRDRLLPSGTIKQIATEATGWGDVEVRFQVHGQGVISTRELRVRPRMNQRFFEVRFVNKANGQFASRFYTKSEKNYSLCDMIDFLTGGEVSEEPTTGAEMYLEWLGAEADFTADHILFSGFRHESTPILAAGVVQLKHFASNQRPYRA